MKSFDSCASKILENVDNETLDQNGGHRENKNTQRINQAPLPPSPPPPLPASGQTGLPPNVPLSILEKDSGSRAEEESPK